MRHSETVSGASGDRPRRASTDSTIVVDEDLLPLVETFEVSHPDGRRTTVERPTTIEALVGDRPGLPPTKRIRAKTIK
ncbi:MAG: hypothetical protein HOV81_05025 [Kofleriaceae bacterium]|nr:hypothetical protein [Kofleriaceae bacterium]